MGAVGIDIREQKNLGAVHPPSWGRRRSARPTALAARLAACIGSASRTPAVSGFSPLAALSHRPWNRGVTPPGASSDRFGLRELSILLAKKPATIANASGYR